MPESAPSLSRSWLDVARSAFLVELYRGRSVLQVGVGNGESLALLVDRGATRVIGVDDAGALAEVRARLRGLPVELKAGDPAALPGRFDVILVTAEKLGHGGPRGIMPRVAALRERLNDGGWLVVSSATDGLDFFELRDGLKPHFEAVSMLGQAPFHGASVAPLDEDAAADPVLDASLAEDSEPVLYVAVAGPKKLALGYGLVLVPPAALTGGEATLAPKPAAPPVPAVDPAELASLRAAVEKAEAQVKERDAKLSTARAAVEEREARLGKVEASLRERDARIAALAASVEERDARLARLEAERDKHAAAPRVDAVATERIAQERDALAVERARLQALQGEIEERLRTRERGLEELREAALRHADEMRRLQGLLDERDAYVAEIERGVRDVDRLRGEADAARRHAEEAESHERAARRRVAELEGIVLRLERGEHGAAVAAPAPAPVAHAPDPELAARIAALEADGAKQRQRADDLQKEAWGHLKARSDAEAALAELREDTVRKLKDARKVANLELMRAMEEATKKAVALREELNRSDRERKDAVAALKMARERLAAVGIDMPALDVRIEQAEDGESADGEPEGPDKIGQLGPLAVARLRAEVERLTNAVAAETRRLAAVEERIRRTIARVETDEDPFGSEP